MPDHSPANFSVPIWRPEGTKFLDKFLKFRAGELASMFSFLDSKTSSAKLAEWSPTDWPESLAELRTIDNLLRCSICYEFFDVALIIPECSHNYCSLCIRRSLSYETQCPTCSTKVNPPSLKNNRVLDELVKNFIKVRKKLLELVKRNTDVACEKSTSKTGDEVKHTTNLSTKRRKSSPRRSNDSKSTSPHNKRQKLNVEEDTKTLHPVKVSDCDETDNSNSGSTPDVITVESVGVQAQVEQEQPMVEEECQTSEKPSPPVDDDKAECPVCGEFVPHTKINSHLDACLTRTEKKWALRSKKPGKSNSSKATKKSSLLSSLPQETPGCSGEDTQPSGAMQVACSSTASTSTLTVKGSNALIQQVQKRKPLPKLVYSVMSEKELRQRLKEWNLSTKGDKSILVKRHQDFVMLFNVQCDSVNPLTAVQVAREVEKAEKARAKEASTTSTESSASALHFEKDQSEEDMDKVRQKYLSENQCEFNKLIADVKRRRGKGKKSTAKKTITKSLEEEASAGISMAEEQDDSSNVGREISAETSTTLNKNNSTDLTEHGDNPNISRDESNTDFEPGYPPFFERKRENETKQSDKSELASMIPEPPSSPSLASLQEDELTPSLGLEDKEWDFEDEETSDPKVIPESPVIKIGKAADKDPDMQSVSSESDDEFQQHPKPVGRKRLKSRLF